MTRRQHFIFIVCITLILNFAAGSALSAPKPSYKRTIEKYAVPDVTLVNQHGRKVKLSSLINSGKPVMLDFIYGTCTTICPVLSAEFSNFQDELGRDVAKVQLISISIDPEHDSPKVMKDYLRRYQAKPGWDFLTGNREDIDRVMRAFDAYVPNKMSHYPLAMIKAPNSEQWVRIYGLIGTSMFMDEYHKLIGK